MAAIDEGSIAGAAPIVIQVLANDVGEGLRVTEVGQPAHGTAVITDIDQTITYTPQNGYLGADSFSYTAADATGQADTALVEIDVRMPMLSVVGNPWSAITTTPVVIPVLDNDVGIGLEVVAVTDPPHGTAVISGGSLNAAMPTVITQGANRLAVCFLAASDDVEVGAATGATGGTWTERHQRLSLSGADAVAQLQTAALDTGGIISGGSSPLASAAVWVTRAFALVPAVEGTTPSYVSVGTGKSTVASPLLPTYPPVVAGDLLLLHMTVRAPNGAVTTPSGWTLLWGPTDASGKTIRQWIFGRIATGSETGDVSVAFTGTAAGAHGHANIYRFTGAQPTLSFEGEGTTSGGGGPTVTYTADAAYTGPDSFSYTAQDDYGQQGTATVSIQVLASAPTVLAVDDNAAAIAGVARTISPLANDRPNTGTIASVTTPTNGTAQKTTDNKQVIYTAAPGFSGTATFDYTMNDGGANTDIGTVTVTVSVPEAIAIEDHFDAIAGVPQDLPVLTNDVGNQNLTITAVTAPNHGGTALAKLPDNKLITYTPAASGYSGPETFSYTVNDGLGHTSTAQVTVEVHPPSIHAGPDTYNATAGVMKTLTPLENDVPETGIYISNVGSSPATITKISGPRGPNTQLNYTAPPNFSGTDEFDYTISDASGNLATSTITVGVSKIAFTPARDVRTTPQDTEVVFSPLANDGGSNPVMVAIGSTDWKRSVVVLNVAGPVMPVANNDGPGEGWTATAGQAKELNVLANDTPGGADGVLTIKSGSITGFSRGGSGTRTADFKRILYTPPATAGAETFTYIATNGTVDSSPATVSIDVAQSWPTVTANPDPGPGNPALIATVGVTLPINVLANDTPTTGLHISAVQNPTQRGQAVINGNRIDYVGNSAGSDVFNYTVADAAVPPHTSNSSVTLTVQVAPVVVTARDDSGAGFSAVQDTATLLSVLANDTPTTGLTIKAGSLTNFSNGGSASISGTQVLYKSAPSFTGTETFKYIATNGTSEDDAQVSVVVTAKSTGGPWGTPFATIGQTRTGAQLIKPTAAQVRNVKQNNADASITWLRDISAAQNNVNATVDLSGYTFYQHSLTNWPGGAPNGRPRRKDCVRVTGDGFKSGLSIYGGEFIGEQTDGPGDPTRDNWAEMKHGATANVNMADANAILFEEMSAAGKTFYVERCIFRKNFDGINTAGPNNPASDKNRFIIRECYAEKCRDDWIENDVMQLLEIEGCLVDGCLMFLSMRGGKNFYPNGGVPPDYSKRENRVRITGVLARLKGQFWTRQDDKTPNDPFKPYAKRTQLLADGSASMGTFTQSQTLGGWAHGMFFKGESMQTSTLFGKNFVPWVDCKDTIFALDGQANSAGAQEFPPGDYDNCHACFLPDLSAGASNPGRNDFIDATWGHRSGLTPHWGQEARDLWYDSRSDWINSRGGVDNNGSVNFPNGIGG